MARFKKTNYDQIKMIPIDFNRQILPGTFEHCLCYLIDHDIDLSPFGERFNNDSNGSPAYDPAILIKIILLAYSRGITSSRKIEQLCRENILFMAVSADSQPHFTTISNFISGSSEQVSDLFLQVLMICDAQGLIGKDMFAIDGCKLPSNASKEWSGKHSDLKAKHKKLDRAVQHMLKKHEEFDKNDLDEEIQEREQQQIQKLQKTSKKIKDFLKNNEMRKGNSNKEVQSNVTDNESAKMNTSHGVIQGYTAVASVDAKHQVIVAAEAFGQGQEHGLLEPMIEQSHENLQYTEAQKKKTKITADSGYSNKIALDYLEDNDIDGYIADTGFRSRDPRFQTRDQHKPKSRLKPKEQFPVSEFAVNIKQKTCICPAGNTMQIKCERAKIQDRVFMQFKAQEEDCIACPLRKKCLKSVDQTTPRQVNVLISLTETQKDGVLETMKRKIDSPEGRHLYSQRLGIVEPVFGNITEMIGIKCFRYRGKQKVNIQWQLMAMIHNMFKIHRYAEQ